MKTTIPAGACRLAVALLLAGGCATASRSGVARPTATEAFGLMFGATRESVAAVLRDASIPVTDAPGDPDTLVAVGCPGAPMRSPCRLSFGPDGLYAAEIEAPASDAARLVSAAEDAFGRPTRRGDAEASPASGAPALVAAWARDGWTATVSRHAPAEGNPGAVLRVERDAVAPPVVAGVPLGRRRAEVERVLQAQGAVVVQRDAEATTYLGCPQGDGGALTCVITFVEERAASVTEVHPTPADDDDALASWKLLAGRLAAELGRQPVTTCPEHGPERATGDCTSTWGSDRLVIVAGAHRNAGGEHRGVISVYTTWSYPPVAPEGAAAPGE
jgi:hypothetical protein